MVPAVPELVVLVSSARLGPSQMPHVKPDVDQQQDSPFQPGRSLRLRFVSVFTVAVQAGERVKGKCGTAGVSGSTPSGCQFFLAPLAAEY